VTVLLFAKVSTPVSLQKVDDTALSAQGHHETHGLMHHKARLCRLLTQSWEPRHEPQVGEGLFQMRPRKTETNGTQGPQGKDTLSPTGDQAVR